MQFPSSWHPDGQRLAFFEDHRKSGQDIWELDVDAGTVRALVVTRFNEADPQYSPDGKWLAFSSDRSGIREVWVMKLPNGTPRQLTIGGGRGPKWSHDGRSFFYTDGNRIWRTSVPASDTFNVDAAKHLPDGRYLLGSGDVGPNHYSIAPDGRVVVSVIDKLEQEPVVVWNWFSEMERLLQN
jgi:Tol biopolymer transport system component